MIEDRTNALHRERDDAIVHALQRLPPPASDIVQQYLMSASSCW